MHLHWTQAGATLQREPERGPRKHPGLLRRGQRQPLPAGSAAPTPSCLVGPRCTEILPFLASNSKKKWSFSELRKVSPKKVSYRRVNFLRKFRSRGKLQTFLRAGLYCTEGPSALALAEPLRMFVSKLPYAGARVSLCWFVYLFFCGLSRPRLAAPHHHHWGGRGGFARGH